MTRAGALVQCCIFLKWGGFALLCSLPWVVQAQSPSADRDQDGLIEIDSPAMLHNMRHDLAGASYKTSAESEGNSLGCPEAGCFGYELTQDLDFDADEDGATWSGNAEEGYRLDPGDGHQDYFPVDVNVEGGWLPIGSRNDPFTAVFEGNSHTISGLAIRRDQELTGLFGAIGEGAAIRNLGLIGNLADYTGDGDNSNYIGGFAGLQLAGSITASHAMGNVDGGSGRRDNVGGLVGLQQAGSIAASHATGEVDGGDGDQDSVGGLVGYSDGLITASHATGDVNGGNGEYDLVGGLVGFQRTGSITASYATGNVAGGGGRYDSVGGLVGGFNSLIRESHATGNANGGGGDNDYVGGLVGDSDGLIRASHATGDVHGGGGDNNNVGGLLGVQFDGLIIASHATGSVGGGEGTNENVGGLVGFQERGTISASYATGDIRGAGGRDFVGGLVGRQLFEGLIVAGYSTGNADGSSGIGNNVGGLAGWAGGSIVASYAVGNADGGGNDLDYVGGLVGWQQDGMIIASYALGAADGGIGENDGGGALVGGQPSDSSARIIESYGFGGVLGAEIEGIAGTARPPGVSGAAGLTAVNAGNSWDAPDSKTLGAWDFGTEVQVPVLRYADYDDAGVVFDCARFPSGACGTLLPGQEALAVEGPSSVQTGAPATLTGSRKFGRVTITSWAWRQLAGPTVTLSGANTPEVTFTAPDVAASLVFLLTATDSDGNEYSRRIPLLSAPHADRDGDGLIDIDSPAMLHNMRHDLAGASYKTSAASAGDSSGCPLLGCFGYELTRDLDFDADEDGTTWSGGAGEGYTLDPGDSHPDYFPVDGNGTGGWLPVGGQDDPFTAVFEGNSHTISGLGIRRDQDSIGLFGAIGGDVIIRNLGLIGNLAEYIGAGVVGDPTYVGGLVGIQFTGSITASHVGGAVLGGGDTSFVGGLVGKVEAGGSITASHAASAVKGGSGDGDSVGGLVGSSEGLIAASHATGDVGGGGGFGDAVGGLVGYSSDDLITASHATGDADVVGGRESSVGGLVGFSFDGLIAASYATGDADGGGGDLDYVGGLVGILFDSTIAAGYAAGDADGGGGDLDYVGGLVGWNSSGVIIASYALGTADGGDGDNDRGGALAGGPPADATSAQVIESYGFGGVLGAEIEGTAGTARPPGVSAAAGLTAANAGDSWDALDNNTLGAWDFGTEVQIPALRYADYDGAGAVFDCARFPSGACGTLLPGQAALAVEGPSSVQTGAATTLTGSRKFGRVTITSWAWRQLAGPTVTLSGADTPEVTFTAPDVAASLVFLLTATDSDGNEYSSRIPLLSVPLADRDGNGLIEIDSPAMLHNMRYNLAGTSYINSEGVEGRFGCPVSGCFGYELTRDLDFDADGDGATWSGNSRDGYTLDSDDSRAPYFEVNDDGTGGWLPVGGQDDPFTAVFEGNSHIISGLGIRRDQDSIGLFGAMGGGAIIRNLGLIGNLAEYIGVGVFDDANYVGGLVGIQFTGSITASHVGGAVLGGGDTSFVGGLVGKVEAGGSITASHAASAVEGGSGDGDSVGGLVGSSEGSIAASHATGDVGGGGGFGDNVGGLVGYSSDDLITASHATGDVDVVGGRQSSAGGLVGFSSDGLIAASYATGDADGGGGDLDYVGGLVGILLDSTIAAGYAAGDADGGGGDLDYVGGLVGWNSSGVIIASYALGTADGGDGDNDRGGALAGGPTVDATSAQVIESYGFGRVLGTEIEGTAGTARAPGVSGAAGLTAANAGDSWDAPDNNTLGAWDFGTEVQVPALRYADYDGAGAVFDCARFPSGACGTLLPGQTGLIVEGPLLVQPGGAAKLTGSLYSRVTITSWAWRQLAGPTVTLSGADTREATFTAPPDVAASLLFLLTATDSDGNEYSIRRSLLSAPHADRDGDGLIEIDSLTMLHNMRHDLAGASYKTSAASAGDSSGCPPLGCFGYELTRDLDFDANGDGTTWSGSAGEGYTLDPGDSHPDYFLVDGNGEGGWLPVGDGFFNSFTAVFEGNGHSIRNLAVRRDQNLVGLFGYIRGAAIRNLGLIGNLAEYTGTDDDFTYVGGLVGIQRSSSITASHVEGAVLGGGNESSVGGLVGRAESGGSITASHAGGSANGRGRQHNSVGGLVGYSEGSITASHAGGSVNGGGGQQNIVGGLVGRAEAGGSITASHATAGVNGGGSRADVVGGLVGTLLDSTITASYAAGDVDGGGGDSDVVGGLVGGHYSGVISASYALGTADGGDGDNDRCGALVGWQRAGSVIESYGFGRVLGAEIEGTAGTARPLGVSGAVGLTAANAGTSWDAPDSKTLGAWDFGTEIQAPALRYADYDGAGTVFDCARFPSGACGTLLPGQADLAVEGPSSVQTGAPATLTGSRKFGRVTITSWAWRQLAGPTVTLSGANTPEVTFTAPDVAASLVFLLTATDSDGNEYSSRILLFSVPLTDRDGNGLIEIDSPAMLHNMRYNLAGSSYKTSGESEGNSLGCPEAGCFGYELAQDLDFDGDGDGATWSGGAEEGYMLDPGDGHPDYFPVNDNGEGGWLPVGEQGDPFTAVFEGNSHTISGLGIRRARNSIGLFGVIGGDAIIRNLGLIGNLAEYIGMGNTFKHIGGLVGLQQAGLITASQAAGNVAGNGSSFNFVGGLVGWQQRAGSITASRATGDVYGRDGSQDRVGGLVGYSEGSITASQARGDVDGGNGSYIHVGGLVGFQETGSITASYARGDAEGGSGKYNSVGGLVGTSGGSITASYATGGAAGGSGEYGYVGGLAGSSQGLITASYATGAADGGDGANDRGGALVGWQRAGSVIESYGFGRVLGAEMKGIAGTARPPGVSGAVGLTAANAGTSWDAAGSKTFGAWDFGTETQAPALRYADYDGAGTVFDCARFPSDSCGTLLTGQTVFGVEGPSSVQFGTMATLTGSFDADRVIITSWAWRQLAGPTVTLSGTDTREATFTAPDVAASLLFLLTAMDSEGNEYSSRILLLSAPLADRDGDGLIEIDSPAMLHNMRYNLAGSSYKISGESEGNSLGCPEAGCFGYELAQELDFDGDGDGATWSGGAEEGYMLDPGDGHPDYFPVDDNGEGGWLPVGGQDDPFTAVFEGNSHTISGLGIRRARDSIGLFGVIGGDAIIRNLGLIGNLAEYIGMGNTFKHIGGLVGLQQAGLITASHAAGNVAGGGSSFDLVGGLVGWQQRAGSITASRATGDVYGGGGSQDRVGGLVGYSEGLITASRATGDVYGGGGSQDRVGGLVGYSEGLITASQATGDVDGGSGSQDSVGGLVGYSEGLITASQARGDVFGGSGDYSRVGGLVGFQETGSITASYARGDAEGGSGEYNSVGGLVGRSGGLITASYATGGAADGSGDHGNVGGLVGVQFSKTITASYATGAAEGGEGADDRSGALVGWQQAGSVIESYGFGRALGAEIEGTAGTARPPGVPGAVGLTAANAGTSWDAAGSKTFGAWDFGTETQAPALRYADYDGAGTVFDCARFPPGACGTLLPGQTVFVVGGPSFVQFGTVATLTVSFDADRVIITSWAWRQLAGPTVPPLTGADTPEATFTAPDVAASLVFLLTATDSDGNEYSSRILLFSAPLADRDGDGLIELDSPAMLHNMRYNLAGSSYKTSGESEGNSLGCPEAGCFGYELAQDLDFDGDGDGATWSGGAEEGYMLDPGDGHPDYFPVDNNGEGGWLPVGGQDDPFTAVFEGNSHTISGLGIRRDQDSIGLFGAIGGDVIIRNLGLIGNLAEYTGIGNTFKYIGGLVGLQQSGSITASRATGDVYGGGGGQGRVGGLVGYSEGLITASQATGDVYGGGGSQDSVGGLVGYSEGLITASQATGDVDGGSGDYSRVGGQDQLSRPRGLVGYSGGSDHGEPGHGRCRWRKRGLQSCRRLGGFSGNRFDHSELRHGRCRGRERRIQQRRRIGG